MLHSSGLPSIIGVTGPLYLDPGSGSILLQVLLAVILGLGIAVRAQWTRIKSLFGFKRGSDKSAPAEK